MIRSEVTCDECGKVEQIPAVGWMTFSSGKTTAAVTRSISEGKASKHYCGPSCVTKAVKAWLAPESEVN